MPEVPPPSWGETPRKVYRDNQLMGLAAYEDLAVRKVLTLLGVPGLARVIAREMHESTGVSSCSFALMDQKLHLPVKFGVARIKAVKFLALVDLFDRWTRNPLFRGIVELSEAHEPGTPLCLVFRYAGDTDQPGPKGGQFMALHTFDSTPMLNTTRVIRMGKLGRHKTTFTLETLESLMASFRGYIDPPAVD